ncbi:hypothetical protein HNQ91_005929 [Filimonas zeae]|uniref:type IX secretion system periplasmic lipoprotein PorW/SprE n=1 Tax=Filimonas zeae TaxID=1737353 RepID=UPI00166AA876|nr:hypothetical protein [Filimonas zeae]MDR6342842.1 hypothetical protein [Filimonas zeae]
MKRAFFHYCCFSWLLLSTLNVAFAQPGSTIYLNKPEKYENRKLGSEKTEDRKFNTPRHIYQNMVTHYNYFFNANNKLNGVITRAKSSFRDDYTELLPFYDFTLDATAQEKSEIDTIIYKCTAGVLLHDLRNDWVDDMYLLLGKTYYYRKDFDSATDVFRYINYAFAPKDDGYDIPIGSNVSNNDSLFSISTNEKRNIYKKLTTHLPVRNEALLWLAHTYTDNNRVNEAASLLEILKSDPQFPKRLQNELHEEIAYWCYTQRAYDSAAVHLIYTLRYQPTKQDRSRKEFLIAQLYQLSGNNEKATEYFMQSASHTINPVQEAYATLNGIRVMSKTDKAFLLQKQKQLLQLARKDKYILYRDVIYYAAAQVTLELHDTAQAQKLLLKSVTGSTNPQQRSGSFMLLGDINYDSKDYVAAHNYYDSVEEAQLAHTAEKERLLQRKPYLSAIAANVTTIHNEDSLQQLAALPPAERTAVVKKELKRLRKLKGLKDDNSADNINPAVQMNMTAPDLFTAGNTNSGEWYFNNPSLKASGVSQFNTTWGKRPNADNWRRNAAIDQVAKNMAQAGIDSLEAVQQNKSAALDTLSSDALLANLPITPEKKAASDAAIMKALFDNGKAFQNQLQDYPSAIAAYTELLRRYPNTPSKEEVLLNLYYCYRRSGNHRGEDSTQLALRQAFPNGKYAQMLDRHITPEQEQANTVTKTYEHIYDLFLEGKFEEAKQQKNTADSTYGTTYWAPQLLYIEAVYYIKQQEDSVAIQRLTNLQKDSTSPLAEKATTMIDVLRRRKEIESYLTKLQITRAEDENGPILADDSQLGTARTGKNMVRDSLAKLMDGMRPISIKLDTAVTIVTHKEYTYNQQDSQFVMILLKKVDPVYINEARNAFDRYNRTNYYSEPIGMNVNKLNDSTTAILLGPFIKTFLALDYINKTKPNTRSRILPWLAPDKYEYSIISPQNLILLEERKDLPVYQELLKLALPDKF